MQPVSYKLSSYSSCGAFHVSEAQSFHQVHFYLHLDFTNYYTSHITFLIPKSKDWLHEQTFIW